MVLSTHLGPALATQSEIMTPADSAVEARFTRKESELLSLLLQNPGKCFSRQFLLRTVWGYGEGAKSRTVDVHIWRLRRKLGPEGPNRIRTVIGAGYSWNPPDARYSERSA